MQVHARILGTAAHLTFRMILERAAESAALRHFPTLARVLRCSVKSSDPVGKQAKNQD